MISFCVVFVPPQNYDSQPIVVPTGVMLFSDSNEAYGSHFRALDLSQYGISTDWR